MDLFRKTPFIARENPLQANHLGIPHGNRQMSSDVVSLHVLCSHVAEGKGDSSNEQLNELRDPEYVPWNFARAG